MLSPTRGNRPDGGPISSKKTAQLGIGVLGFGVSGFGLGFRVLGFGFLGGVWGLGFSVFCF